MTLAEATSKFIEQVSQIEAPAESPRESPAHTRTLRQSLELLTAYFSGTDTLEDVTAERLRDFLARWYVEKAWASPGPGPKALVDSLADFFRWADERTETRIAGECLPVLEELGQSIPRALRLAEGLSNELAGRGGAFGFPEFLTSFDEGGRSSYDLDAPGEVGAIEGYFRVTRVEGASVEAEEIISEERVWPIIFPAGVARLIEAGMIVNLELIRTGEGWRIAASGFAYPPGTEV
ncbi:MAG TPA: hypothetical protein VNI02_03890 [Blastocatellia bacterium]|jgi:hypothetical protein|nr:hypothetical protein [Blastocatellia bacterium]